jgi:hypothetical protein
MGTIRPNRLKDLGIYSEEEIWDMVLVGRELADFCTSLPMEEVKVTKFMGVIPKQTAMGYVLFADGVVYE